LPLELHQSPPDYFLLIDSGANVHVVWDRNLLAYAREHFSNVQWGIVHATSACIAIGHLHCTVFALNEDCNLVLMMTSPSRYDKDITIFEATYDRIPNLQLLPRVGCFCNMYDMGMNSGIGDVYGDTPDNYNKN